MQISHDFRGSGARCERDCVSRGDEVGSGYGYSSLLFSEAVYLILEGAIVTKCLIKQGFDGNRSAMCAAQKAAIFEFLQVASNRRQRNIQFVAQVFNRDPACLSKLPKDERIAVGLFVIAFGHSFLLLRFDAVSNGRDLSSR